MLQRVHVFVSEMLMLVFQEYFSQSLHRVLKAYNGQKLCTYVHTTSMSEAKAMTHHYCCDQVCYDFKPSDRLS